MQQQNVINSLDTLRFISKIVGVYPIVKSQGLSYWFKVAYTCLIQTGIAVFGMVHCIVQQQELFHVDEETDPDTINRITTISYVNYLNHAAISFCVFPLLYFTLFQGETFSDILRSLDTVAVNLECSREVVLEVNRRAGIFLYFNYIAQVLVIFVDAIIWNDPLTTKAIFVHVLPILMSSVAFSAFECQWIFLLTIKQCLFNCLNKKIMSTEIPQKLRDTSISGENIELFRKCHADLCDLAAPLTSIFQPTLLLWVPLLQLGLVTCLYWTMIGVWDHLKDNSQVSAYVVIADSVSWFVIYFVRFIIIASTAHATQEEAAQTLNDLQKLEFDISHSAIFEEVQLMREQLQHNCRAYKFPVFGLFCIDRGFLWAACGSVVAYLVTVLQFHLLKSQLQ